MASAVVAGFKAGDVLVDPAGNQLEHGSHVVQIEPRHMELLMALAESPGSVCSRGDLLERVWPGRFGADDNLTRSVSALRKAFKTLGVDAPAIETVPKRGYRLALPVEQLQPNQSPAAAPADPAPATAATGVWPTVAVAPFKASGSDAAEVADAISSDLATALSHFAWLQVQAVDAAQPGTPAPFQVTGQVRRHGAALRVAVDLSLTNPDGGRTVLWSRSSDLTDPADGAALDMLVARMAASLGDPFGRLMQSLCSAEVRDLRQGPPEVLPALLRLFVFRQRVDAVSQDAAAKGLAAACAEHPDNAQLWAALGLITAEEFKHDFNRRPQAEERALDAVQRAVDLAPNCAFVQACLAEVRYFRREVGYFRAAADRAAALNPFDSNALGILGVLRAYAGDWDTGIALTDRAMALNPDHPGWYHFPRAYEAYWRGDLDAALAAAERVALPTYYADAMTRTVIHAARGELEQARAAGVAMRDAGYGDRRIALDNWWYAQPELIARMLADLQQAGVDIS